MKDKKLTGYFIVFLLLTVLGAPHLYAEVPSWKINTNEYEFSMQFVAVANIDGMQLTKPDDLLAVFVGNECRGVTHPIPVNGGSEMVFYLNAMSNSRDELLTFKIYCSTTDRIVDGTFSTQFVCNDLQGSVSKPVVVSNLEPSTGIENTNGEVDLIMYCLGGGQGYQFLSTTTILEYSLYNLSGTSVANGHVNNQQFSLYNSGYPKGIYLIRIKTQLGETVKKFIF